MLELAKSIVFKAFKDKVDKSGESYLGHLYRVYEHCGYDERLEIIALLHDILEDCPEWSEENLRCLFHNDIVDSVVALTHKKGDSYDDYITQVLTNKYATIVKKHDLHDNMDMSRLKTLTEKDIERLKKYHKAYLRINEELNKNKYLIP